MKVIMDLFASHAPDDVGEPGVAEPGQTPPPARVPRTSGRIELGDWDMPTATRAPRRWLFVAAIVPWLVVVAVLVGGQDSGAHAPSPSPDPAVPTPASPLLEGTDGTTAPDPTPSARTAKRPAPPDGAVIALGGASGPGPLGQAQGLAAVAARAWLSTRPAGPPVDGLESAPGAEDRYVEHLAVESVDHPARGALVVTLRAIVLPVEGDSYGPAEQVRVAVPVTLDADRARLGGQPWLLPVQDPTIHGPVATPVDDVDLMVAAAEAVTAAGYRDVELEILERTSGWAWVARVRARAPGQDHPDAHVLWLRSDVGRLVVAGTAAPTPGAPPSADEPTSRPSADEEASP